MLVRLHLLALLKEKHQRNQRNLEMVVQNPYTFFILKVYKVGGSFLFLGTNGSLSWLFFSPFQKILLGMSRLTHQLSVNNMVIQTLKMMGAIIFQTLMMLRYVIRVSNFGCELLKFQNISMLCSFITYVKNNFAVSMSLTFVPSQKNHFR